MIDWKEAWNETFPDKKLESHTRVKRKLKILYKSGMSFARLSLMLNRRVSSSGIRTMLIQEGVHKPKGGGK